ncbi:MAG: hypothetical protein GX857_05685 [Bacteroidales bacterium]|nr:hypothetical protein [Bacteroidales bacterium]
MAKLRGKRADKMGNGLILLVFGFLLLLIQLRITNHWFWMSYVKTPATFFFLAGTISLWLKHEKALGYILSGIGLIGYADIIFKWSNNLTLHAFPLVVMAAGITMMFFAKRK